MLRVRTRSCVAAAAAAASLLLATFVQAPPARAQQPPVDPKSDFAAVAALADEQTMAVVEVDLEALNVEGAAKWLGDAAGKSGQPQQAVAEARQQLDQSFKAVSRVVADLRAGKARRLYWLFSLTDPTVHRGGGPGLIVVPVPQGADAAAVANVLSGGRGNNDGGGNGVQTATLGGLVVAGSAARVEQAQARHKALPAGGGGAVDGAAVSEALAAGGDAPVRIALVASNDLRKVLEQKVPDLPAKAGGGRTEVITQGAKWASLAVTPPPNGTARLVVRASDAHSAMRIGEQIAAMVRAIREDRSARAAVGAEIIEDAAKQLAPRVEGNQVVVSVDQQAIDRFIPAVAIGLRRQQEAATRMVTMSNMRQILLGFVLHANENKNAFPPEEKWQEVIMKGQDLPPSVFNNPRLPGKTPGFVYVRPAEGIKHPDPAHAVVLYEPAEVQGDVVGVGFLDGHVEMMSKADFEKNIKPKLPKGRAAN